MNDKSPYEKQTIEEEEEGRECFQKCALSLLSKLIMKFVESHSGGIITGKVSSIIETKLLLVSLSFFPFLFFFFFLLLSLPLFFCQQQPKRENCGQDAEEEEEKEGMT